LNEGMRSKVPDSPRESIECINCSTFESRNHCPLPAKTNNRRILIRAVLVPAFLILGLWLVVFSARILYPKLLQKAARKSETRAFGIVSPGKYLVYGIDVSHHQGNIKWEKVREMVSNNRKVTFVFVKATEGITRQDKHFNKNWKNIEKEGFIRGAYHFYYPSRDAKKQAANFMSQVKLKKGDLPPVVDIEHANGRSKKQICDGLNAYIREMESEYGLKPIIYTNISFYYNYLSDDFDDYTIWISGYHGEERFREKFTSGWHFWQYSEDGRIEGIRGNVDCNVFKGTGDELKKLCIK